MKILLVGSGGREHALAWKLAQSPRIRRLYTLPGNPGTAQLGENLPGSAADLDGIVSAALEHAIDLVVVGPEDPLAAGLIDRLAAAGIPAFGPNRAASRLEGSKAFAKDFMARHEIPSAGYATFTDFEAALAHLRLNDPQPETCKLVLKASGLAAGKGVILPANLAAAEVALRELMIEKRFGEAGAEVVIEERLAGREVSLMAFTDGETVLPMPPAQDHKRLLDGDEGPNTGGMGAFAPSPFAPPDLVDELVRTVLQPAVDGLRAEGVVYRGVLYAGLMLTDSGPKVLEFNCRFGDPETQAVLPLLDSDLLEIMFACVEGRLGGLRGQVCWKDAAAVCVVLASGGYPEAYPSGLPIRGAYDLRPDVVVFQAGTRMDGETLVTAGGRVLGVTGIGEDLRAARAKAYAAVDSIDFEGRQVRTDIALTSPRHGKSLRHAMSEAIIPHIPSHPSAYARAGVDIDAGNRAVSLMKEAVRSTYTPAVLSDVGAFGGLFSASAFDDLREPVLVATTDGVGTKVALAVQAGRTAGIGHDIVNHCINDVLVQGARPLFFLDYIASSRLEPETVAGIVAGMAEACRAAGCALLGGETAEMPGVYAEGHFDVVGTLVGVVERAALLPRGDIRPGDLVLGFPSSGPHTNGFSLIRKVFAGVSLDHVYPELGVPLADALLAPHRSYLQLSPIAGRVKALAHITGGGFPGNIPRVLPGGLGVAIRRGSWPLPPLFDLIRSLGGIDEEEMYTVFNMGIGMAAIVDPAAPLPSLALGFYTIGRVTNQEGVAFV